MSGFSVERSDKDTISVLNVSGFLDLHTVPKFEEAVQSLLKDGRYRIVVNFNKLDYISSAGLGVFMGFIEEVREHKGDIKLCCMSDRVYKVFDLLGFPALFEIVKNEEMAIQKFNSAE